jgi:hypothetical protein
LPSESVTDLAMKMVRCANKSTKVCKKGCLAERKSRAAQVFTQCS